MLKAIYDFVATDLPTCMLGTKVDVFKHLMLALMKLRLNLADQDLANRFGISQSTVLQYFDKIVELLYVRLAVMPIVYWPVNENYVNGVPLAF